MRPCHFGRGIGQGGVVAFHQIGDMDITLARQQWTTGTGFSDPGTPVRNNSANASGRLRVATARKYVVIGKVPTRLVRSRKAHGAFSRIASNTGARSPE